MTNARKVALLASCPLLCTHELSKPLQMAGRQNEHHCCCCARRCVSPAVGICDACVGQKHLWQAPISVSHLLFRLVAPGSSETSKHCADISTNTLPLKTASDGDRECGDLATFQKPALLYLNAPSRYCCAAAASLSVLSCSSDAVLSPGGCLVPSDR